MMYKLFFMSFSLLAFSVTYAVLPNNIPTGTSAPTIQPGGDRPSPANSVVGPDSHTGADNHMPSSMDNTKPAAMPNVNSNIKTNINDQRNNGVK